MIIQFSTLLRAFYMVHLIYTDCAWSSTFIALAKLLHNFCVTSNASYKQNLGKQWVQIVHLVSYPYSIHSLFCKLVRRYWVDFSQRHVENSSLLFYAVFIGCYSNYVTWYSSFILKCPFSEWSRHSINGEGCRHRIRHQYSKAPLLQLNKLFIFFMRQVSSQPAIQVCFSVNVLLLYLILLFAHFKEA